MFKKSISDSQIKVVASFDELVGTPFQGNINALCWSRDLEGDFKEIVDKVDLGEYMTVLGEEELLAMHLSPAGCLARTVLLNDFKNLTAHGTSPILNVIKHYERDDAFPFFPTDVYSFHVDRSTVPADTMLCTYHGTSSDIIANSDATQKILVPELREKLKKLYDGAEAGFEDFLKEYFFDLHYQVNPEGKPTNLGLGHLWRLAIDHPGKKVPPCIHRAPKEKLNEPRLLMIC